FLDALEPDLAPPGINTARAEHLARAVVRAAPHTVQNDRRRLQCPHLAGLFVDETFNDRFDPAHLAAIRHELDIEKQAPVLVIRVQRCQDLLQGLHTNKITGLDSALMAERREPSGRDLSFAAREWHAPPQRLKAVIEPARRYAPLLLFRQRTEVVDLIDQATYYLAKR